MVEVNISIIIATWNAAMTLKRCLDSIVPQLTNQTELILVDGGSKDETNKIIESYGDKITIHISEKDEGIYDAWNKGIKLAKGKWIMFIGADDKLMPGALNFYLDYISKYNYINYDFISCKIRSVKKDGTFLQLTGRCWSYKRCKYNMDVTHVASLTSRNYFERIGDFNTKYKICGDYELLMRGGNNLKALFADFIIAEMPIGGASFSVKALKEQFNIKHDVGKVSWLFCVLIYIYQLALFYTYTIRHSHNC